MVMSRWVVVRHAVVVALALLSAGVPRLARGDDRSPITAAGWMEEAYRRKAAGDAAGAATAFRSAASLGADEQRVELELGYLDATRGDRNSARGHFERASAGADPALSGRARAEIAVLPGPDEAPRGPGPRASSELLDAAYRAKAEHRLAEAHEGFERARAAGADPQLVAVELGYIAAARGDAEDAQLRFEEARRGPDPDLAGQAGRELSTGPRHWSSDVYADAIGAAAVGGVSAAPTMLVPTLRVRGYWRPSLSVDAQVYAYAQGTRDTASSAQGPAGVPAIYADDYALFGIGARYRLWGGRIGLFAQVGPAANLVRPASPLVVDARAGFDLYAESARCAPPPAHDVVFEVLPCAEVYAEGTYASRFDNNVFGLVRPRGGFTYMVTGPVAWQVIAEARAGKDLNDDYYNNFIDAGVGPRWRLLSPFRLDVLLTADAGTYLGLQNVDPAPSTLAYGAVRLEASTYMEY
jgi:hypothetical protein